MFTPKEERKNKMTGKHEKVVVIGLGYVGLPLAIHFAECGFSVLGIDKDERKIASLLTGNSYIPDVPSLLLQDTISKGQFRASLPEKSLTEFRNASYCIVTVPTPLDENDEPDLDAIKSAAVFIQKNLPQGLTIIFESSSYPGTLEEVILPILEQSGKKVGQDFFLGYSPERIDPSNRNFSLQSIPKVVSGQTTECKNRVISLYQHCFDKVVPVSSPRIAEMCKLFENIQRFVNISLVNEVFQLCRELNIDFYEALQAAATKPFGFTPYWPGPGIGGHCIPVDPLYFQWKVNQHGLNSSLIESAQNVNKQMPLNIVKQVQEMATGKDSIVLLIGMAYKKDVNDLRESPSLDIFNQLINEGFDVRYHDPYFSSISVQGITHHSVELTKDEIQQTDVVVILTDHSTIHWELIQEFGKSIIDTRGILRSLRKKDGI